MSSTSFENLEQVEQSIERGEQERAEREQERREAHEDEQAILGAIQDDRVTVRLKGKPMTFAPFLGDAENFIDDLAAKYGGEDLGDVDDPEELDGENLREYVDDRERLIDILNDHNKDEGKYGRSFWSDLPMEYRMEVVNRIREGGEETARAGN